MRNTWLFSSKTRVSLSFLKKYSVEINIFYIMQVSVTSTVDTAHEDMIVSRGVWPSLGSI
jgi:hypothetical protein